MCNSKEDRIELNDIISDLAGCNIEGRISYAITLIEEGDIKKAKSELEELLTFIEEV